MSVQLSFVTLKTTFVISSMSYRMLAVLLGLAAIAPLSSASLFRRTGEQLPPCAEPYTDFVYSGCYIDAVSSRSLPFQTTLEFNNATVQQCTAWCKGNGYRYAGLEYYGTFYAHAVPIIQFTHTLQGNVIAAPACIPRRLQRLSVICLAMVCPSTTLDRNSMLTLSSGDKTQVCGGADRISIYQDPTFPDADDIAESSEYMSLGCYTEGTTGRSLIYSQWDFLNAENMTTETCLEACGSKGYPFAGTEFGRECYCGVVLGNGTTSASADSCSTPCTGNSDQFCGGPQRLSLYVAKNL